MKSVLYISAWIAFGLSIDLVVAQEQQEVGEIPQEIRAQLSERLKALAEKGKALAAIGHPNYGQEALERINKGEILVRLTNNQSPMQVIFQDGIPEIQIPTTDLLHQSDGEWMKAFFHEFIHIRQKDGSSMRLKRYPDLRNAISIGNREQSAFARAQAKKERDFIYGEENAVGIHAAVMYQIYKEIQAYQIGGVLIEAGISTFQESDETIRKAVTQIQLEGQFGLELNEKRMKEIQKIAQNSKTEIQFFRTLYGKKFERAQGLANDLVRNNPKRFYSADSLGEVKGKKSCVVPVEVEIGNFMISPHDLIRSLPPCGDESRPKVVSRDQKKLGSDTEIFLFSETPNASVAK